MSENRKGLRLEDTWDLSTIFPNDDAWEKAYTDLEAAIAKAAPYKGHLLDSAQSLLEITEAYMALNRQLSNVYVYAHMKNDQDTTVATYQSMANRAWGLYSTLGEVFSFYQPEFLAIDDTTLEEFIAQEPGLALYTQYFNDMLRTKAHVLSQAEEALLAGAGELFATGADTFEILDNADIAFPEITDAKGETVQITHGNYMTFLESSDRRVRQAAYEALYSVYEQFQHTYAKTLQATVKSHNFTAKVRHYDSARQAALDANAIPEAVYDTMLTAVRKHLPLLHRYVHLKAKILGLDDIKMFDVNTPLSHFDLALPYEEAKAKAAEVLTVFGEDYSQKVDRAFNERWIDVHPNKGKRSGAYSGGAYDTNAFMLLNWQNNLDALFTLIHETGHSIHSTYTRETQPYVYGDYSLFLAEIASTTNENILTETLLKEAKTDQERFAILNNYLDGFRGTVFRQAQFAEFELRIHEADAAGQVLTSDYLNALYADINEAYYGLSKEDNPHIQYEWARIPHFYYDYYVYQYATGFCAASYLAERIVHGTEAEKEAYLDFLKAGSSDYSLNIIKAAGVDMTQETYLDQAFALFEDRLKALEDLVDKGVLETSI